MNYNISVDDDDDDDENNIDTSVRYRDFFVNQFKNSLYSYNDNYIQKRKIINDIPQYLN